MTSLKTHVCAIFLANIQLLCLGQITVPYNPDGDANGFIGSSDLQDMLTVYNTAFAPGSILIDTLELSEYLAQLESAIAVLQEAQSAFQCGDKVFHEGYWYRTVQMGEACWYAENVRFLPAVSPGNHVSNFEEPHAYVWGYLGSDINEAKSLMTYQLYGGLYNYQAAIQWELCPSGWHVPSISETSSLIESIRVMAGVGNEASYLKQQLDNDTTSWLGTNMSGFGALPGGRRNYQTYFNAGEAQAGSYGFWMSLDNNTMRSLKLNQTNAANLSGEDVRRGVSIRCIQDME